MKTIDAISIGNVAMHLQTSVRNVEKVAARLRLLPVLRLDNVAHFSDAQVEQIRGQLKRSDKQ